MLRTGSPILEFFTRTLRARPPKMRGPRAAPVKPKDYFDSAGHFVVPAAIRSEWLQRPTPEVRADEALQRWIAVSPLAPHEHVPRGSVVCVVSRHDALAEPSHPQESGVVLVVVLVDVLVDVLVEVEVEVPTGGAACG